MSFVILSAECISAPMCGFDPAGVLSLALALALALSLALASVLAALKSGVGNGLLALTGAESSTCFGWNGDSGAGWYVYVAVSRDCSIILFTETWDLFKRSVS